MYLGIATASESLWMKASAFWSIKLISSEGAGILTDLVVQSREGSFGSTFEPAGMIGD